MIVCDRCREAGDSSNVAPLAVFVRLSNTGHPQIRITNDFCNKCRDLFLRELERFGHEFVDPPKMMPK